MNDNVYFYHFMQMVSLTVTLQHKASNNIYLITCLFNHMYFYALFHADFQGAGEHLQHSLGWFL